jgi:hypothetical protein
MGWLGIVPTPASQRKRVLRPDRSSVSPIRGSKPRHSSLVVILDAPPLAWDLIHEPLLWPHCRPGAWQGVRRSDRGGYCGGLGARFSKNESGRADT